MSAFMVDSETIQRVVNAAVPQEWPASAGDDYGRRLIRLNAEAMRQRYGHNPEVLASLPSEEEINAYHFIPRLRDAAAELVAVQCLKYQCSEGNVPETALYAELVAVERRLLGVLAEEHPGYRKALKTCWK